MTSSKALVSCLADYVTDDALASRIPGPVLERARLAVLDIVGCMLAATTAEPARALAGHLGGQRASGRSCAVGVADDVGAQSAALCNSTLSHLLELDDGHRPSGNHLGCVVVPAALAVAQEVGASGAACLEAIVAGYDVMGRIGEAVALPRRGSHFHGTGTTGVFGAAAVASRLLGLTAEQAAHALAIAGTAAAGLRESTSAGPECKPLHAGRAARNGIESAQLALAGYHGPLTVLEGRDGFCAAMSQRPRPELICRDLGTNFAIQDCGFKLHATCGMLFTVLDTVLDLRASRGPHNLLDARIVVSIPSVLLDDPAFMRRRPASGGEAHHSVPYSVAAALVDGQVSPAQMTPGRLADPAIAAVESHVEIEADEAVDRLFAATVDDPFFFYPSAVRVEHAGTVERFAADSPRGYDPRQPLREAEVVRKFRGLTAGVLPPEDADSVIGHVLALDTAADVGGLLRIARNAAAKVCIRH